MPKVSAKSVRESVSLLDIIKGGKNLQLTTGLFLTYEGVDPDSNEEWCFLNGTEARMISNPKWCQDGIMEAVVRVDAVVAVW